TCSWGWACIGPGGPLRWYYCSGAFAGGADCGGAFDCVGYGPECPVGCYEREAPTIASCGPVGLPYDRPTRAQVAGGCNPCRLAMSGGAQVTVTDSHGDAATAAIR